MGADWRYCTDIWAGAVVCTIGVSGGCRSGDLRLVEIVEEVLFDSSRVRVVLVEEGLIDQVLADPLERVFSAVGVLLAGSRICERVKVMCRAYSTSQTSFRAFLTYGASFWLTNSRRPPW